MSRLEKLKLLGQGCGWFVLGIVYSVIGYAIGQYLVKLF